MMKFPNPFSFHPGQVTWWTTSIYLAIVIPLLYVHETVPSPPAGRDIPKGINLTEAWSDLQAVTKTYHPYNSHENDGVREFLIDRSKEVLGRHGLGYTVDRSGGVVWDQSLGPAGEANDIDKEARRTRARRPPGATIFDDRISNVTYTYSAKSASGGQYFEGNNFYVYIHGKEDPEGDWWRREDRLEALGSSGGVLVNCHFDSVSTGYGATDDGMSCVSLLQLLSYFTTKGRQPKNGIVLLFNNAEEDGLLGANAFGYSPLLKFCHTFVNLEGAGAGGRAMLFRTTDLETAQAYGQSPHPFGSVVAANAFQRGVIKSGTDFQVFVDVFGQRGLDIAFYEPRTRYHTEDDDVRHTSVSSIWHMLSAALESTRRLSETNGIDFSGPRLDGRKDLVQNGRPTEGVWFDWFGGAWTAFPLRGLFAWSLTLLIATPLVLVTIGYLLMRNDRFYLFAREVKMDLEPNVDPVSLGGWRGFFRFPIALTFSTSLTIGFTHLLAKFNPLIVSSSGYAVWAMAISLFYFTFWLIMRASDLLRPSALQRAFALFWLFILSWAVQVLAAVAEDRLHVGALYFAPFLHTAVFLSLVISMLELFALPGKREFAERLGYARAAPDDAASNPGATVIDDAATGVATEQSTAVGANQADDDADAATETTPLRAGEQGYGSSSPTTFASTYRRSVVAASPSAPSLWTVPPYKHEQSWSGRLPSWTWFVQLLLLAPTHVILLGNLGLVLMTSTQATAADGSNMLVPLVGVAALSILLLLPLTPFIHRVSHHIPLFLAFVFIGTLVYNLVAFPFSVNNRFKFRFQQVVDLDDGTNLVTLTGLEAFVRPVIAYLPAASGQTIECRTSAMERLVDCAYDASSLPPPNLADDKDLSQLVSATATRSADGRTAKVQIEALNTRTCYLDVSSPVYDFSVDGGGARDDRFGSLPKDGFRHLQLWRRTWGGRWNVTLQLVNEARDEPVKARTASDERSHEAGRQASSLEVTVRCAWDDANKATNIPALHEVMKYMPSWATATKKGVGLVHVKKSFRVPS
ncbi:hypothetical protein RJ55_04653 [Drechmeria coniospora]|nr:hypothetical protein RJ55_04653 [Drechmeria coniospora]